MSSSIAATADRPLQEAATSVVRLTSPVFTALAAFGEAVTERVDLERHPVFAEPRAWDALEPVVTALLHKQPLFTGAGLAVRPSGARSGDTAPSMAWWVIREGEVRAKQHVVNPHSDSFYDVPRARWFRVPYTEWQPTLLAPYVDSWGTDDVTMTAAAPLHLSGVVAGVVAADLNVRSYVDQVEHILAAARATAVLDEDDRVIAATHPRLEAGTRLLAMGLGPVQARAEIPDFGWAVVRL